MSGLRFRTRDASIVEHASSFFFFHSGKAWFSGRCDEGLDFGVTVTPQR